MDETRLKRLEAERDAWRELAQGRAELLVCYRTGSHRRADKALERIERAEAALKEAEEGAKR